MHGRASGIKLTKSHLAWLYGTIAVLFITGVLWYLFHYFILAQSVIGPQPHPLAPWMLKIHGAAAMLFLILIGSLISIHIRRGWSSKMNRLSGAFLVLWLAGLIVSGYFLYYVGDDTWRSWSSWIHQMLGVGLVVILWLHIIIGRNAIHAHRKTAHEKRPH